MQNSSKKATRQRGSYSILFALFVPITFGFCALSVDLSYMQFTQMQLQHVADAASHAALVRYRQTTRKGRARRSAKKLVEEANFVGNGHADLDLVEFGRFENGVFISGTPDINATRAHVSRMGDPDGGGNGIPLFFAPFLGVLGGQLGMTYFEPSAVAMTSGRVREICIAQDITGSFHDDIGFARQAVLAFLDYFEAQPYPGDKLAMSTFVGGVEPNIFTPLSSIDSQYAAIDAQWSTLDSCNCDIGYYFCHKYYGNYNGQPWMQDCYDYGSMTAQGPGIDQCVDELLSEGSPTAFKAIVLISDGLPCCSPNSQARAIAAVAAADAAWAEDVHLWSVAYMNGGGDFSFLQSLVRGYGVAFETPDPAELEDIMIEIANSIPIVLVE